MYALSAQGQALMNTQKKASSAEEIAARLAEAAKRANEEADARRAAAKPLNLPPELGGPKGLEPTRYGDWEKKGLISDF
ncbi:MAG: DUF1674 domain-containing protein [Alphaproteobacteria bacterium]|nr:DUF1674 domain-containing protein [Alphaproteobacteria bacterium]